MYEPIFCNVFLMYFSLFTSSVFDRLLRSNFRQLTRVLETRYSRRTITFTPWTNINSNLLLLFPFTCFSAVLLSHNLSRLHFSLLFSPAPRRVSLYCFWIFSSLWILIPPQCVHSPPASFPSSVCFSASSRVSLMLFFSFALMFLLTNSSSGFDLTIPLLSTLFLFISISPSCPLPPRHALTDTHTFSNCLSPSGLQADKSWHVSQLSCRVTELLDSSQLSGWPISAVTHTFWNKVYVKVFHHFSSTKHHYNRKPNDKVYSLWKGGKRTSLQSWAETHSILTDTLKI